MTIIRPFYGVRPTAECVAEVASVPYDVVNTEEALQLAAGRPRSFLHVVRSEIDLPPGTDLYAGSVYLQAKKNFDVLINSAAFVHDRSPSLYIYQQHMNGRSQTAVVGCVSVDEYDVGKIKVHEKTRADKENDRVRHLLALNAHAEPVFLAYKDRSDINSLVAEEIADPALYDFTAPDGIRHVFWQARRAAEIAEAFRAVPETYIADGHHRSASASRARAELRRASGKCSGNEEYDFFLAAMFPSSQLKIMPYNRLIKRSVLSPEQVLNKLRESFFITPGAAPEPSQKGSYAMYLGGVWHGLAPRQKAVAGSVVAVLDVSVLQEQVLKPLFGIDDPRTSKDIDFVGGIRGSAALKNAVDRGLAFCAFALYPVSMEELFSVADAGLSLPPKSTWFEPKLRSGLVVHTF